MYVKHPRTSLFIYKVLIIYMNDLAILIHPILTLLNYSLINIVGKLSNCLIFPIVIVDFV